MNPQHQPPYGQRNQASWTNLTSHHALRDYRNRTLWTLYRLMRFLWITSLIVLILALVVLGFALTDNVAEKRGLLSGFLGFSGACFLASRLVYRAGYLLRSRKFEYTEEDFSKPTFSKWE